MLIISIDFIVNKNKYFDVKFVEMELLDFLDLGVG